MGCALCLIGTVIIVVNAPEDRDIETVDEILSYALQTPFLTYCVFVAAFSAFMMFKVAPQYGRRTPLVYLSICSLVGSISVMSVKAFGIALRLTFNGHNQLTHLSTYAFALLVVLCIMVQMNYFNKALDQFSTNVVNPIYYVMFTTSTIFASVLLFQGFHTGGAAAVSLLGGFIVTFLGVYLLNVHRDDGPHNDEHGPYERLGPQHELPTHTHQRPDASPQPFVLEQDEQGSAPAYPMTHFHDRSPDPATP